MSRSVSASQGRSEDTEHCLIAGCPLQDGWTFLDVRPPHEIAKVHPAAAGSWRVRGMRRPLLPNQLSTGRASKLHGKAEYSERCFVAWHARTGRASELQRQAKCSEGVSGFRL